MIFSAKAAKPLLVVRAHGGDYTANAAAALAAPPWCASPHSFV